MTTITVLFQININQIFIYKKRSQIDFSFCLQKINVGINKANIFQIFISPARREETFLEKVSQKLRADAPFIRNSIISASLVNSLFELTCTNQIIYSTVGQTEQGNLKAEKNF